MSRQFHAPNRRRFPDCYDCEGRGGGPCRSCRGGDNDCDACHGEDWQECDTCEALSSLIAAVVSEQGVARFTPARVRDAMERGYLDEGPRLTFKGRLAAHA
jgi:hypothetical protein